MRRRFLQFEHFGSPCPRAGWVSGSQASKCSSWSRSPEEQASHFPSHSCEEKPGMKWRSQITVIIWITELQWPSEYRTPEYRIHMNNWLFRSQVTVISWITKIILYSNGPNLSIFKWHMNSGLKILNLKGKMASHNYHLKSGQKRPDFVCSGIQMVGTIARKGFLECNFRYPWTIAIDIAKARPFENWTIWNPTFKKFGFQMVGFQIFTVWYKYFLQKIHQQEKHSIMTSSSWYQLIWQRESNYRDVIYEWSPVTWLVQITW